jgi:hypothetical protein
MESMQSNGETSKSVWTGAPDGKSYPVEASTPGYAAAVKQSGPDVQELTVTLNGKPAWKSRSTLSKDGKTINSVVTGTTPKGEKLHNVTVWEKQ